MAQRSAEGQHEQLLGAGDSGAIPAAYHATRTIPIVMTVSGDPVRAGYITSLAQPGGTITGLTLMVPELAGKRLQLLTAAMPGVARGAVLGPSTQYEWSALAEATQALGLQLHAFRVDSPDAFEPAFTAAMRAHADALLVLPSPLTHRFRRRIVVLAAQSRLPARYPLKEYVEAGGLMADGWSISALYRRAATSVDKILKGATPADLPVERPTTFELVINLKTAQALDLIIPPVLLFQADEVLR